MHASAVGALVGGAVLLFILWRQRQARPLRSGFTVPVVLVVLGAVNLSSFARATPLSDGQIAWIAGMLVLDAVGLGAVRALTVRVWTDDQGRAWRQGTWWTISLWVVGVAAHVFAEGVSDVGSASTLLYLGITLAAQRLVLGARLASTRRPTG